MRPGLRSWKPNGHIAGHGCARRPRNCATTPTTSRPRGSCLLKWMALERGDLYGLKDVKDVRGQEQAGTRYAVVVPSDDLPLSKWLIAPTSTGRRAASFRPEVEFNGTKT